MITVSHRMAHLLLAVVAVAWAMIMGGSLGVNGVEASLRGSQVIATARDKKGEEGPGSSSTLPSSDATEDLLGAKRANTDDSVKDDGTTIDDLASLDDEDDDFEDLKWDDLYLSSDATTRETGLTNDGDSFTGRTNDGDSFTGRTNDGDSFTGRTNDGGSSSSFTGLTDDGDTMRYISGLTNNGAGSSTFTGLTNGGSGLSSATHVTATTDDLATRTDDSTVAETGDASTAGSNSVESGSVIRTRTASTAATTTQTEETAEDKQDMTSGNARDMPIRRIQV